jgi:DNA-binding transcriptional ArsR family regulator
MPNEQMPSSIKLTPRSLKALVHPLRVAMLGLLRADGPATSSGLARRLETSSGATSYHLRQLERHGFVVEVPGLGTGRERYWEAADDYTDADRSQMYGDADALVLFDEFTRLSSNLREAEVAEWIESQDDWGDAWTDAAATDDYLLRLSQSELADLVESIRMLVLRRAARPRGEAPDGSAAVRLHFVAFPIADPGAGLIETVKSGKS